MRPWGVNFKKDPQTLGQGENSGAQKGTRTPTHSREADFKFT